MARERYFTRARLPLVLFDFATATISVVDVATDALVILEYRAMGADAAVFFHLSAGIFALSSLVFSAIFVAVYLEERADLSERLKDALGRRCRTLVLLALVALALALAPVGQALPVVMWAGETFWPKHAPRRPAPPPPPPPHAAA